jgi:hypothetical protein
MTAEQTQSRIDWNKLLDEALTAPGNLTGVHDRFWDYSFGNMMLFLLQGIHGPVASFSRWKSLGRHVIRGSKAKVVIVPILVNEPALEASSSGLDESDQSIAEKRERVARLIGFKAVRLVFPLSHTEGKDLPPVEIPGWNEDAALAKRGISQVPLDSTSGILSLICHLGNGSLCSIAVSLRQIRVHGSRLLNCPVRRDMRFFLPSIPT